MKKYDLSNIMKGAWRIWRNTRINNLPFSECLKRSWHAAKFYVEQRKNDTAPVGKFENGMTVTVDGYTRVLNRWTKGNQDRVYINGGSRKGDGWVDIKNGVSNLYGHLAYQTKIAKMILALEF